MKNCQIFTIVFVVTLSFAKAHNFSHNISLNTDFENAASEQLHDSTSKVMTVDDLLFSEDLFPGHVIPQNIHHTDAIKLFTKLLDDHDLFSQAYEKFLMQHDKKTDADDTKLSTRKRNFRENLHFIFHHNLRADTGQYRFQVGVNMFADMYREEMKNFLGAKIPFDPHKLMNRTDPYIPPPPPHSKPPSILPPPGNTPFPHSFSFRDEKLVSPVKNQQMCGSCVFFSHAALMEALHAIKNNGEIINVSEQMMLDCAVKEHGYVNNDGCEGNMMEDTGQFLMDHGVSAEDVYRYTAKQDVCLKQGKEIIAKLKSYWQVDPTVEAFKHTLVSLRQPIAVGFIVHHQFMFYRAGVYDWCMPPNGGIGGHAVLVVGYGHFFDTEYFIVKNSWGNSWGEAGYVKYIVGSPSCEFESWGFTGSLV